jgi:NDP-sugar pyrophosphorylase family protein
LSDGTPKPALPVLDVPLGAFGLVRLRRCGLVIVNVAHQADHVVRALRPFGDFEVLDERPEPYGSAGTVLTLLDRLDHDFVTFNSDVLIELDVRRLLDEHRQARADGTIVVRPVSTGADALVEDGLVTGFVDRRVEPGRSGYQFLGVAAFRTEAVSALDIAIPAGLGESILRPLAERGRLRAHVYDGYWCDVGTFDRYLEASLAVLDGKGPLPPVEPPGRVVEIEGGRAYVGPDATVGAGTIGPGAVVLAGATVAAPARVERSIVLPGTRVDCGIVTDSVYPVASGLKSLAR